MCVNPSDHMSTLPTTAACRLQSLPELRGYVCYPDREGKGIETLTQTQEWGTNSTKVLGAHPVWHLSGTDKSLWNRSSSPPPRASDPKGPESLSKELRKNWEKKFNSNSGLEYLGANNINWLETGFVNYSHPKTCFFLWEARNSWDLTEALHTTGKEGFPVKNEKGQWETHNNDAFWLQPKSLVCFGVHS